MWRLAGLTLVAVLLALPAMPARAVDLTFDVTGAVDYDDNVFRRDEGPNGAADGPEADVLFRLRPGVRIHEDRGQDINYSLKYMLPLEVAAEHQRLDDIDHIALGSVSYHPNDRLSILVEDDFRYLRSTLVNQPSSVVPGSAIQSARDRVSINLGRIGGRYLVSSRLSMGLSADHRLFETTRKDRQDNQTVSATIDGRYLVSERHEAGLGLTYRFQDLQRSTQVVDSDAHSINLFVQWRWQVDETTGLDVSAGPSVIRTRQDSTNPILGAPPPQCAQTPPGPACRTAVTETSIDVFAQIGVIKRWTPTLRTGARYVRSQGTASGIGGTVINDSVTATIDWEIRERWEATLRGDFSKRKSVSRVTLIPGVLNLNNRLDNDRWGATARLAHRLARQTRVFGEVRYNNQNANSNLGSGSDFENWIFTLGFHHIFEPIKLF